MRMNTDSKLRNEEIRNQLDGYVHPKLFLVKKYIRSSGVDMLCILKNRKEANFVRGKE